MRLAYYNEPAEPLLGVRFDEVGGMATADWLAAFRPGDAELDGWFQAPRWPYVDLVAAVEGPTLPA